MKKYILPSLKLTIFSFVLLAGVYSSILLFVAQIAPGNGEGQMVSHGDKTFYTNVGQSFTADQYFWSRPSAVDYNAAGSGGSNKGPTNPEFLHTVQARIDTILAHNPDITKSQIPVDMITASGSGLDPDISVQAAKMQVKRIARTRNLSVAKVEMLIQDQTEKPFLGLFGPQKINVLKLNIALDELQVQRTISAKKTTRQ